MIKAEHEFLFVYFCIEKKKCLNEINLISNLNLTPNITAKELKENKPRLLSEVSVRTLDRRVIELRYSN